MNGPPTGSAGGGGSGATGRPTSMRQLLRQQRELEEKRKFGLAPLAVDSVSHQEISPNVPHSVAQAPWYYGASGPTLDHQRKRGECSTSDGSTTVSTDEKLQDNADQIVVLGKASRYVAGACKNCGSRTHKTHECTQSKKKVGALYTHNVTGEDILVKKAVKVEGHRRERYVGDVGVDLLLQSSRQSADTDGVDGEGEDGEHTGAKRARPQDVFQSRGAQHGGVEIQALPKYLQNLDAQDEIFYDPKTGSMRGNPNAQDSTRSFQGDLERYRTGGFYSYVEAQHRYLTGKAKSFVDFDLDATLNTEISAFDDKGILGDGYTPAERAHDTLMKALYGESSSATAENADTPASNGAPSAATSADADAHAVKAATPASSPPAEPEADSGVAAAARRTHDTLMNLLGSRYTTRRAGSTDAAAAAADGHAAAYGSYLDPVSLRWGYNCCKGLGRLAPPCQHAASV